MTLAPNTLLQASNWTDSPKFLLAAAIIILLVMLIVGSSRQKRELSRTEEKLCAACGSGHPPFAQFCRKCGNKL